MGKYQELLEYLTKNHILDKHNINEKNISFWLSNEFKNNEFINSCTESERIKKVFYIIRKNKCLQLINILSKSGIPYILFKGIVLAERLYELPYYRPIGDIDLFVSQEYYYQVVDILQNNQYDMIERTKDTNHHIVFNDNDVSIELHKNILNPFTNIDETYIRNHTETISIEGNKITTFDDTATLLHLIYHLYMDTCLSSNNIYAISTNKSYGIAKRFLYRAYEIALLAEKFFKDIKWNDIISDIKIQKLRIVFKYMVEDILEIFPNAFPAKLVDVINSLEYVSEQNDDVYKIIRTAKAVNDNNGDLLLSKYIDENWNYNNTAICKHLGECFEISKPVSEESCGNKTLSCELLIDRCEEGISLQFTVSDDDFYVSDYNNFGTLESDGVHLLLCGTQKYTYMSIFLVPKIKNDSIEVFAYDVLNNTLIDSMDIQARIQKYDDYYILQAVLSNEFLSKYEIDKYFYVGFVISDCDRETKYRKNALISSDPETEWYNPLHFLKVDLLDY